MRVFSNPFLIGGSAAVVGDTISGGAVTVAGSVGVHRLTPALAADTTVTLTSPVDGRSIEVWLAQDATGGWLVDWVSSGRTIVGRWVAPDLTPSSVTGYVVSFQTVAGTAYTVIERIFPAAQVRELDGPAAFLGSNLERWWRPDSAVATATNATSALDAGPKGNHLANVVQGIGLTPGGGPNSTPIFDADGVSTYLTRTSLFTLGAASWSDWSLVNVDAFGVNLPLIDMDNAGLTAGASLRVTTGPNRFAFYMAGVAGVLTATGASVGAWTMIRRFFDDAGDLMGISANNETDVTLANANAAATWVQAALAAFVNGSSYANFKFADSFMLRGKYRAMQNAYAVAYFNRRYSLGLV